MIEITDSAVRQLRALVGAAANEAKRELEALLERRLEAAKDAERAQERGQLARAPEHAHAQLLEGGRGSGPGDVRQGPVEDFLDPRVPCHCCQPRWALTIDASFAKAGGSDTASSARILRSSVIPAFLSPAMNTE